MKILIVGILHKKYDKRVFRTVKALSKAGEVTYVYWTEDKNEKPYSENNVKFIPLYHKLCKISLAEAKKRISYEKKLVKILEMENYDILYLHHVANFFPKAPYKIGKKKNATIVTDFHEYITENYWSSLQDIFPNQLIGKQIFRYLVRNSHMGIFVSQSIINEALNFNENLKALCLSNYSNINITDIDLERKKKKKNIIFVGGMKRDLSYEIEVMKYLAREGFEFTTIGVRYDLDFAKYIPFLPYNEMMKELSKATFSLVSYSPYSCNKKLLKSYVYSMPNKFFDSVGAVTPVIIREEFTEMKEYVDKYKVGVVIPTDDPKKAAKKIEKTYSLHYESLLENIRKHKEHFLWTTKKEEEFLNFIISSI